MWSVLHLSFNQSTNSLDHRRRKVQNFTEMVKNWQDAENCTSRGADLVSIHNMEEENFLSTHTKGKSKWIGLQHNPIDGGYHWSDATPVSHTNWGHGEPNNHEGREDCVEMVSNSNGTLLTTDLCSPTQVGGQVPCHICFLGSGRA
uniref:C-type lectin domain-containing protein n=1 Tax=Salmo trutta TaxID=8032 RepID=A0A673Y3Z5_SALTR